MIRKTTTSLLLSYSSSILLFPARSSTAAAATAAFASRVPRQAGLQRRLCTIATTTTPTTTTTALQASSSSSTNTRKMSTSSNNDKTKPTMPETYVVPTTWQYDKTTMAPVHGSNIPTSGAQTNQDLPRGKHDIQLYGLATPNGVKASILLEELVESDPSFEYDAYFIHIGQGDQFTSGFVGLNPNSKIPALYDQSNGARVFESGAILCYLAEKYSQAGLMPTDPVAKAECLSWVFFQVGSGPYYGGGGWKHFMNSAPIHWEYAIDRYTIETKRIMDVMDKHLEGKKYFCGDEYTIADIMHWKWNKGLLDSEFLNGDSYQNLKAWAARVSERPAVKRGQRVLGMGNDAIRERHSRADLE